MSAALQLPRFWVTGIPQQPRDENQAAEEDRNGSQQKSSTRPQSAHTVRAAQPDASLAFYRKHTERTLRRYLYASMQVGRAPSILGDPVSRGWASSRPIRTFEDAVIFVLDMEMCLNQLPSLDRQILSRVVLQEYTQAEAASLLGMSVRTISYKFPAAMDRLTEKLLDADLLVLPQ